MQQIDIIHRRNKRTLYNGTFTSVRAGLEQAVSEGVDLSGANLRHLNLAQATLDDGIFNDTDFTGSNLTGANLSEAALNGADFSHCALESACFSFSSLQDAVFCYARFGGTYINGVALDRATFTGTSFLHLAFIETQSMQHCRYIDEHGKYREFSQPPILIHGLSQPVAQLGSHLVLGTKIAALHHIDKSIAAAAPTLYKHRDLIAALSRQSLTKRGINKKAA